MSAALAQLLLIGHGRTLLMQDPAMEGHVDVVELFVLVQGLLKGRLVGDVSLTGLDLGACRGHDVVGVVPV